MEHKEIKEKLAALKTSVTSLGLKHLNDLGAQPIDLIQSELEPFAQLEKAFDRVLKNI